MRQTFSTSPAGSQARDVLLILTSYHRGTLGSSGVASESRMTTSVPSWMGTTLSADELEEAGVERMLDVGTVTTARPSPL